MNIQSEILRILSGGLVDLADKIVKESVIIHDIAEGGINSIVQGIIGGDWRGEGADRFVGEMATLGANIFVPLAVEVAKFAAMVLLSLNDIEETDKSSSAIASSLSDDFRKIYA